MQISVTNAYTASPVASALGELFTAVSQRCVTLPEFNGAFSATAGVEVTLGDAEQCERWHVTSEALGFHAVATGIQYDTIEDEIAGSNGWLDVNEKNEAVVNMTAAADLCIQHRASRYDRDEDESFMISMMVTPIHEILHVAEFLERSRGRTPVEVFDQDHGEDGLRTILEDDGTEDRVESLSLRMAENLFSSSSTIRACAHRVLEAAAQAASEEISILSI